MSVVCIDTGAHSYSSPPPPSHVPVMEEDPRRHEGIFVWSRVVGCTVSNSQPADELLSAEHSEWKRVTQGMVHAETKRET